MWCRDSGGEFLPFLNVSKGKKLLSRLLPFLKHDPALKILRIVTSNLPTLMSKDTEEVEESFPWSGLWVFKMATLYLWMNLLSFRLFQFFTLPFEMWSEVWRSVSSLESSRIWCPRRLCPHTSVSRWPVRTRSVLSVFLYSFFIRSFLCFLTSCFSFQFGLSLLYALLSQGEKLLSSGVPLEPSIGDFETWCGPWVWYSMKGSHFNICVGIVTFVFLWFRTDTIFQVAGQLSQCSLVEPLILPSNLLTLFCRYLDKRTVHQLKSNIE